MGLAPPENGYEVCVRAERGGWRLDVNVDARKQPSVTACNTASGDLKMRTQRDLFGRVAERGLVGPGSCRVANRSRCSWTDALVHKKMQKVCAEGGSLSLSRFPQIHVDVGHRSLHGSALVGLVFIEIFLPTPLFYPLEETADEMLRTRRAALLRRTRRGPWQPDACIFSL